MFETNRGASGGGLSYYRVPNSRDYTVIGDGIFKERVRCIAILKSDLASWQDDGSAHASFAKRHSGAHGRSRIHRGASLFLRREAKAARSRDFTFSEASRLPPAALRGRRCGWKEIRRQRVDLDPITGLVASRREFRDRRIRLDYDINNNPLSLPFVSFSLSLPLSHATSPGRKRNSGVTATRDISGHVRWRQNEKCRIVENRTRQ